MKNKKVLLGLSGGVDSAVAALFLRKKGYEIIGAFMINFSDTKNKITGDCNYLEDKKDAQKIASILNIPLKILNFEKQYKKHVINKMFEDYSKGLTPNPDSLCNKIIKFPLLWKHAKKLDCDYIATGHYIKKTTKQILGAINLRSKFANNKTQQQSNASNCAQQKGSYYTLKIPKDKSKDQSYFLYDLTQFDLEHTLFPLGNLTKEEVRAIAKKQGFPNHNKKSTSGICFVGKINFKSFLQQKIKSLPGLVLDTNNNIIGNHPGISHFTIGERVKDKEITINNEFRNKHKSKLYISKKNKKTNTLTVVPENHKSLFSNQFKIIKLNWISHAPNFPLNCKVRIRHLGELYNAKINKYYNKIICHLNKPIQGIAEGQSCVIYKNSEVLGGGEIRY
jgi:tRNA-uridine 2-sulfurtransferase